MNLMPCNNILLITSFTYHLMHLYWHYLVYCSISELASLLSISSHVIGLIFSCKYSKITNNEGTIKIWNNIPINIPPMADVPSERLALAPTPNENIKGNRPIIMAKDVIKIGRRRAPAPSTAAQEMLIPIFRRSRANSTIKMAFLANRPINMISAICT